jgi:hypothetical protein
VRAAQFGLTSTISTRHRLAAADTAGLFALGAYPIVPASATAIGALMTMQRQVDGDIT